MRDRCSAGCRDDAAARPCMRGVIAALDAAALELLGTPRAMGAFPGIMRRGQVREGGGAAAMAVASAPAATVAAPVVAE